MNRIAYVSPGLDSDDFHPILDSESIVLNHWTTGVQPDDESIFIVDEEFARQNSAILTNAAGALIVSDSPEIFRLPEDPNLILDYSTRADVKTRLRNLIRTLKLKQQLSHIQDERDSYSRRLKELNNIGIALTTERNLIKLGKMILQKSREITFADAGSLYLVEIDEKHGRHLRAKILQNDSLEIEQFEEFVIPITKSSVAGYVATTGEAVNIPDVYLLSSNSEFSFNRLFDESTGYRTVSNLAVPMKNPRGEITGVIQLLNRKTSFDTLLTSENYIECVRSFDHNDEELVSSLASQAAVALDNSRLIRSIETLFEGFVTAAVTAIESRDPTTSGHSFRVSELTVGLAEIVDKQTNGPFRNVAFTGDEIKEMRYAALLHDFGKVGVRENVLVKAKKLYPLQLEFIEQRLALYKKAWEADYYNKLFNLLSSDRKRFEDERRKYDELFHMRLKSLDDYMRFVAESNEPTVLAEGNFEKLIRIANDHDLIPPGMQEPILNREEIRLLSIRKGSLNDEERVEIESHVTHTYLFLSKIPWTPELKEVPRIAYGHHEKLNGNGYPNRLGGEEIPVQTRMMTISDIYDALTASDRPYKKAVPPEKALNILEAEVQSGQIDSELFQIFLDAKIYKLVS